MPKAAKVAKLEAMKMVEQVTGIVNSLLGPKYIPQVK